LKRIRFAAAAAAVLSIAIVIAVTSGGGGGESGSSRATTEATAPQPQSNPPTDAHGGHSDIYVADARTGRVRRLTTYANALQPSWSPNRHIAYSAADCDECYAHLFFVDRRGVDQRLIRARVRQLFHPTWSPAGSSLAAVALGRGIYTVPVRGGRPRKLTSGESDEAPAWSPSGDWIAFDRRIAGTNYDLFAVNALTRKLRRLTHDHAQQTNPSWSPDGSRLAFAEQQRNGRWGVFIMRLDGSGRKRVTASDMSAQEPAWSPDGARIAFIKQGLDSALLAVIDVAGRARPTILSRRRLFASKPAWSPDGTSIAFSAQPASSAAATSGPAG
jgi:Tol biopolymer transport system component